MSGGYASPWYGSLDDFGRQFYETNPEAGYASFRQTQNAFGNSNFANWANGQFGRYHDQYMGMLAKDNPISGGGSIDWSDFLQSKAGQDTPGGLQQEWQGLSPQQRGVDSAPRFRWLSSVL